MAASKTSALQQKWQRAAKSAAFRCRGSTWCTVARIISFPKIQWGVYGPTAPTKPHPICLWVYRFPQSLLRGRLKLPEEQNRLGGAANRWPLLTDVGLWIRAPDEEQWGKPKGGGPGATFSPASSSAEFIFLLFFDFFPVFGYHLGPAQQPMDPPGGTGVGQVYTIKNNICPLEIFWEINFFDPKEPC